MRKEADKPSEFIATCERVFEQSKLLADANDALARERDALRAELRAWHDAFETTQLTHAVAEHAKLLGDKRRLDWVEKQTNGNPWTARQSFIGRGFRLHNTSATDVPLAPTARQAIDKAMEVGQ